MLTKSQHQNSQKKEEEAEPKAQNESWHQNIRAVFIIPPIIQYNCININSHLMHCSRSYAPESSSWIIPVLFQLVFTNIGQNTLKNTQQIKSPISKKWIICIQLSCFLCLHIHLLTTEYLTRTPTEKNKMKIGHKFHKKNIPCSKNEFNLIREHARVQPARY